MRAHTSDNDTSVLLPAQFLVRWCLVLLNMRFCSRYKPTNVLRLMRSLQRSFTVLSSRDHRAPISHSGALLVFFRLSSKAPKRSKMCPYPTRRCKCEESPAVDRESVHRSTFAVRWSKANLELTLCSVLCVNAAGIDISARK